MREGVVANIRSHNHPEILGKICVFGLKGMWYRTEDTGLGIRVLVLAWLCDR